VGPAPALEEAAGEAEPVAELLPQAAIMARARTPASAANDRAINFDFCISNLQVLDGTWRKQDHGGGNAS
jgi:hypothetical protein